MKSARRAHLSALPSETEEPERWEVNEGGGGEGEQIGLLQGRRTKRKKKKKRNETQRRRDRKAGRRGRGRFENVIFLRALA